MTIQQALQTGFPFKRIIWTDDFILQCDKNGNYVINRKTKKPWIPTVNDIMAIDWSPRPDHLKAIGKVA
jgi:hypothetical protein